jgi:L-ascorbate metabolism protein UlaG (beta-lactamase superfamily)
LVLATHIHSDHFSAELVLSYLKDNPETVFISTQSAVEAVLALDSTARDRLIPIQIGKRETERIMIKDIDLEAIYLSHGIPGLLNLGFIITVDGIRLFHTGDIDPAYVSVAELQAYGLPAKQIDIAFVIDTLVIEEEYHDHVLKGIQPQHIIPMHFSVHLPPTGIESVFPNAFIFQEPYQSWVMP